MPGVFEMRRSVDSRKHHEEKTPRRSGQRNPCLLNRAIERGIGPQVVGCRAKDRATERNAMGAVGEAAGNRRADRDAFGHEIEHRRRRGDVAVEPGALHAAIAARSTPLFPPSTGGGGAIQPANTRNAGAAGITAEQEWDVRDAGRRGKHRRPHTPPTGLDDEAGEVREIAARQQLPQDVGARAIDEDEDRTHVFSQYRPPPPPPPGGPPQPRPRGFQTTYPPGIRGAKGGTPSPAPTGSVGLCPPRAPWHPRGV